ncbi:Uncharacterized protein SCF082_LOCUS1826, partial [Durusdinium trenchii]
AQNIFLCNTHLLSLAFSSLVTMERRSFFRPAVDFDALSPLSDSDHEVFADAPRMAALIGRKRQSQAQPEVKPARSVKEREAWADLQTDDEDNFPSWEPKMREAPSVAVTQGLRWDPLGLEGEWSPVSDLLFNKMAVEKQNDLQSNGTVFDKWSWSTTATEVDALPPLQEESSPSSRSKTSDAESEAAQASQSEQLPSQAPQNQLRTAQLPIPSQMLQMSVPLPPQLQLQQVAVMPTQAPQQMMVPVQMPMGMGGMGMLPIIMQMPQMQTVPNSMPNAMPSVQNSVASASTFTSGPQGPAFGCAHRFHPKNSSMGVLSADARSFTKRYNKGRLSIISENKVHFKGTVRYAVQFTEGELCSADGVGFILSSDLPCTRNIQKIISIFVNRTGRICVRVHDEVERCPQHVKCLEIGDWLEVAADLEQQTVSFTVWPQDNSEPSSATVHFKEILQEARGRLHGVPRNPCGFLAVVMKHLGVSVKLAS